MKGTHDLGTKTDITVPRSAGVLARSNGHALERYSNYTGVQDCRSLLRARTPALRGTHVT